MGQEKQWGRPKVVKVGEKQWVFPHSREQIAADEKKAAIRTAQIKANVAAGKRN